jgi:thiol-disulfide isomerase/thioredoxin/uncharacterized membrane protein YphA (DoxX/SURF4 family)
MIDAILLIIRLVLFAVFSLAAIGKFLDLKGSEKAVRDFGAPEDLAKPLAIALPFAEIVFAFCFLFVSMSWVGAIGALILLLTFIGGILWQMAQGNAPDCHCFGQIHSEPVSKKTLIRNIVFALLTLILIAAGRDDQGTNLADNTSDAMQLILIFAVLAMIGAALFYLRKVIEGQAEILKRIELLEVLSHEGVALERHDAGSPHDGLPIGSPFPSFELSDADGRRITRDAITSNGRPAVVFFVSPTCDPCRALLPEIEAWEAELGGRLNFIFVSNGDADANRDKFGVFSGEVILQEKREIAEAVFARWTPSALFVRADGTIGSHVAAGDNAIRELIGKIRSEELSNLSYFVGQTNNAAGAPKIGQTVPAFTLNDIDGNEITSRDFDGDRTLAVFWSPTCPHCTAMMNELKDWDSSRTANDPKLIVFSDGKPEEHASLGLRAPIVLDAGYKTSEKLGMYGTPSAVLVDEKGTIVTETAMGAINIWALIGKRK